MEFRDCFRQLFRGKAAAGGKPHPDRLPDLETALAGLRSPDEAERRRCRNILDQFELTPSLGLRLIATAADKDLPAGDGIASTQAHLIHRLFSAPHPSFVEPLESAYAEIADKPGVPNAIVGVLAKIDTEASLSALVRLVGLVREESNLWALGHLSRNAATASRIFPGLLAATPHESCQFCVAQTVLDFAGRGLVQLEKHPDFIGRCLRLFVTLLSRHRSGLDEHQETLDFQWGPERQRIPAPVNGAFADLEMLADLLGWTRAQQALGPLRDAMQLRSVRLRVMAASALARLGAPPDAATMEGLAADSAGRALLWCALGELREAHFPERFNTHEHLAEATVVSSLEDKEDYQCWPQTVELVKSRRGFDENGEPAAIFFYRLWLRNKPAPVFLHAGPFVLAAPPELGHTELYPMELLEEVEEHTADDLREQKE